MADAGEKLVSLARADAGDRETTVYVKGFLGRNETADDFARWRASHRRLGESHAWGPRASGYTWPAGSLLRLGRIPVPLAVVSRVSWEVYRRTRHLSRIPLPVFATRAVVEELTLLAGRLVFQYIVASRRAVERAERLAARLRRLRRRYDRLRVVGHSLGCRHLVEAVALLDDEQRPDEIHLCAPAFRERDLADRLGALARESTYVYYCERDLVLTTSFRAMALGSALGAGPPQHEYERLHAIDASEAFEWWVHHHYSSRFHELAVDGRGLATR